MMRLSEPRRTASTRLLGAPAYTKPSTSCCWQWTGSSAEIWLASAVIIPNVNEASPRKKRIRRKPSRRSLRILRRGFAGACFRAERGTRSGRL